MKIRIASPEGEVTASTRTLAPVPTRLAGLRLGLFDNGKPNAARLLRGIGDHLARRTGASVAIVTGKGNAAAPSDADTLANLRQRADVVLAGSGD